mmetsp:Transcript_75050/g.172013  ORF Transcript_75050/g.172013 Transcript_75050/m.172013 type:complete len:119 (+) Transcript_75050:50-406(+)
MQSYRSSGYPPQTPAGLAGPSYAPLNVTSTPDLQQVPQSADPPEPRKGVMGHLEDGDGGAGGAERGAVHWYQCHRAGTYSGVPAQHCCGRPIFPSRFHPEPPGKWCECPVVQGAGAAV